MNKGAAHDAAAPDTPEISALDHGLLLASLARMRLIGEGEQPIVAPLTGGVSSDIWKVRTRNAVLAIKRARAQLKVATAWHAPVERNAYEVRYMRLAEMVAAGAVPAVKGEDRDAGLFAMAYLDPASHPVWKAELAAGRCDVEFAAAVGALLVRIHAATAGRADVAAAFPTDATFHAIRLEAYLEATAQAHPQLHDTLMALSRETLATKKALVHGDVSPKNILVGPHGPVFLDAECAWYGEPAFDLAFCLKHLLLKCLWVPAESTQFLAAFDALTARYLVGVDWEEPAAMERRVARLLPALWLARVDGKSPVEYLDDSGKARVRKVAMPLVATPPVRLAEIRRAWAREIGLMTA